MSVESATPSTPWRNAIVGYGEEDPEQLLANPFNAKIHPQNQQAAIGATLDEIGWIAPVIVNEVTQHVVDGHARVAIAISRREPSVPVAYVRLTPEDERIALATFDPLGALAVTDAEQFATLLDEIETSDQVLVSFLADLHPEPRPPVVEKPRRLTLLFAPDAYEQVTRLLRRAQAAFSTDDTSGALLALLVAHFEAET